MMTQAPSGATREAGMPPERLENVEVLRGVAAFSVMWFHLTNGNEAFLAHDSLLRQSGAFGYLGVQLFFVISGFIIPYSLWVRNYHLRTDGLSFLARRLIRLEPAYLLSIAVYILLQLVSAVTPGSNASAPGPEIAWVVLLHVGYLAPWFDIPWLSPVYWSLAIEFQYYIAILFLAPLLLAEEKWKLRCILSMTAVLPLLITDERSLFPYLPLFGLGFTRFLVGRQALQSLELSFWGIVFIGLCWFFHDALQASAAIFGFGFLFLRVQRPMPALSFLGHISYSVYLLHVPIGGRVINLATRLPQTAMLHFLAVLTAVILSVLAAYYYWRVVERPSTNLARTIYPKLT
jgi:peptidoglycan/LPS O-acetylase OafA/YrhL